MGLYELAVLGEPSDRQVAELTEFVSKATEYFGLRLHHEIGWHVRPTDFNPKPPPGIAAVFYGSKVAKADGQQILALHRQGIPIVPVASELDNVNEEIPEPLNGLNCIAYSDSGTPRIATALLECASLLPKQRRIFISYRRNEARAAAVQLFAELSARQFDVFLDTHGIPAAEDFAATLWHGLCGSDIVLMLHTEKYLESAWVRDEVVAANTNNIPSLRVEWPGVVEDKQLQLARPIELDKDDLVIELDKDKPHLAPDPAHRRLSANAIQKICQPLENLRCQGQAYRYRRLIHMLEQTVEEIGGTFKGTGPRRSAHIQLRNGKEIMVYPTVGVPTSANLHKAATNEPRLCPTVMYDHIGLHREWRDHLDWLGSKITDARWLKVEGASKQLQVLEAGI